MIPTIIFDLDNTLCECSQYYVAAHVRFSDLTAKRTGLPPEVCLDVLNKLDLAATKLPNGWCTWRMPRAYHAASLSCDVLAGIEPDGFAAAYAGTIASEVFKAPYTLFSGAKEVLTWFSGWQLVLLTKGDPELQQRKIDSNGLGDYFDAVHIVPQKSADVLRSVIAKNNIDPTASWMVGDSPKDDIGPALELGMQTILIGSGNGRWAYEDTDHFAHYYEPSVVRIASLIPQMARKVVKADA